MKQRWRTPAGAVITTAAVAVVLGLLASPRVMAQTNACSDAEDVGAGTYTGTTDRFTSDGSANCGESTASPDAWFRYTATKRCFLLASTCGSDYDTVLSIHSGCPGTLVNQLSCNDDACDLQSTAAAVVEADETYWIRVSGYSGDSGDYRLEVSCVDLPEGDGPDPAVSDQRDMRLIARLGQEVALAWESVVCNLGNEHLSWFSNPNPAHPFMAFNLHRLKDDRFEQIGQSWVKHAFQAVQEELCGVTCIPAPSFNQLGIGCADVYSTEVNAWQDHYGPRSEINPWTGDFTYRGSHIQTTQGGPHGPLDHMVRVVEEDLNAADAEYFVEMYVISSEDADHMNSIGWESVELRGRPGGNWTFDIDSPTNLGSVLDAWQGATRTVIPEQPTDDGRCVLAGKATDNGDGTWHYEYALYNHDMDRQVASFTIPVSPTAGVAGEGFYAVLSHGEGYSNEPWTISRDLRSITWSTADNNPLRWGTVYNFRFDARDPPGTTTATLGLFKPGEPAELTGSTVGPFTGVGQPRFKRGDSDGNGQVDLTDPIRLLNFLFLGGDPPTCFDAADGDDSGELQLTDAVFALLWLFSGGAEMPAPGPRSCGVDLTPSALPLCEYDESSC